MERTKNKVYLDGKEVTNRLDRQLLQNSFEQLMGLAIKIVGEDVLFPEIKMLLRDIDGKPLYVILDFKDAPDEDEEEN